METREAIQAEEETKDACLKRGDLVKARAGCFLPFSVAVVQQVYSKDGVRWVQTGRDANDKSAGVDVLPAEKLQRVS